MAGSGEAEEKKRIGNKLQRSYFDVLGLCCSSEVPLIENILKSLEGVVEISVIVPARTVIVVHDNLLISQIQIVKALNEARLEANVRMYGKEHYKKKWPSPYAIGSGILLALSLLKYVYHPMKWLALGAVAVGIPPIALKTISSLRNFRIDINILVIIAVVGTIAMNDYIEAGTIVFLFAIAEWLESRASYKAKAVMSSLMNIAPQNAVIAGSGEVVESAEVKVNTVIAVKAGEVIPIDGVVVEGKCDVDEKTLTGESFPVAKQFDSSVWAGTINLNGYISVKTTALAEDCVVAKMAKLVEEAQNNKSKTQRFIDKCAKFYTPTVLVVSACFAVVPVAMRVHNRNHWFHMALVVLVSACPCSLILSTPVATFCALTKAAKTGLLIKGGDYLETLAKIKVIAFDKTGTITTGEFVMTDFRAFRDDVSSTTLLYWVSSIESKSSHPMASAIISYGKSLSVDPKPDNVEEFQNFPGEGVYGKIDGNEIYIGNRKIAERAGCRTVPNINEEMKGGKTVGYIFSGAALVGTFSLSDACRSGVEKAIKELKSYGIKTAMLTGDCHAAAMHAQEQIGNALEVIHAELLPKDKAKIINDLKKEGPTAMIGDGVNDAPALATADIGISMGISGSALATETGHVILMSNDIRKIPKAIKLAKKAYRKVFENVFLSFTTKAAILALGFAGHPLVGAAVAADTGTCLLVIFNSMLLLRGVDKHERKHSKSSSAKYVHKLRCCFGNHGFSHDDDDHHGVPNSDRHVHKHCCSENKAQKLSLPQHCDSNSCGKSKCAESVKPHETKHIHDHDLLHHDHHVLEHCCSENKVQKVSLPLNCALNCQSQLCDHSNSCGKSKCAESVEPHETKHIHDHELLHLDHHVHKAKHCCSGNEAQIVYVPQNCATKSNHSNSCEKSKSEESAKAHQAKHFHDNDHDLPHHVHNHCCPEKAPLPQKCASKCQSRQSDHSNSCEKTKCSGLFEQHEVKLCHGRCEPSNNHTDLKSHTNHNHGCSRSAHSLSSCRDETQNCCSKTDISAYRVDGKTQPLHTSIDIDIVIKQLESEEKCKTLENREGERSCGSCSAKCSESDGYVNACKSLEKREVRSCCKSYMKECCGTHGHFGSGFGGGGLSEIITE